MFVYQFETSQPLTQHQIDFLNRQLVNLPNQDTQNFEDVPEFTTEIELVND